MNTQIVTDPELITRLQAYQQQVQLLRTTPYLAYPAHVHLETLGLCNASCSFCPYTVMARKGERMPDALIDKVIDDLTAIPRELPFQFSPFKVSDPFLEPRLFSILAQVGSRLPNARVSLITNGQALTEKKLDQLLAVVNNPEYLWVSLNEYEAEPYRQVMGLDIDITLRRLAMLHRRAEHGLKLKIVIGRVANGTEQDARFVEFCKREFPLFEACTLPRGAWLGQVADIEQAPVFGVGCLHWFELSITCTGVVAHCCMDGLAQYPIGNINNQSVLEIYNSPAYRTLREKALNRLAVSPCNQCAFM